MSPPHLPGLRPPRLNPAQLVLVAFLSFIAVGTGLLALPISHAGGPHALVDDLFNATSAVCVTGLSTLDPGTRYSLFGQVVLLGLFQIGGLGYMTLFTLSMLLVGKRLSIRDRLAVGQVTEQPGIGGLVRFIRNVARLTFLFEAIGFVLLAVTMVPELGWRRGLFNALFHAVSAFNNAGFSLMSDSLMHWQHQPAVLLPICGLIILGGLGYNVNQEWVRRLVLRRSASHRWDTLMAIILASTATLLLVGTGLFWYFEAANPRTLGGLPVTTQLLNAFVMAVQPRTAGFNSVDTASLTAPTMMMTMVLMFLGAGPGGTSGGIKLTTAVITLAAILATVRGQEQVPLFSLRRVVSEQQVRKAFTVMAVSLGVVVGSTMVLASLEPLPFLPLLFEAVSAFSTTGLSLGITSQLSVAGKLVIVATMLVGRLGVLAILVSIVAPRRPSRIHYMEDPLLIG
ncbi:MAG: potassium transporter TrkG [Candidatus Sericytochromatia bacterium]|nr:potassium transporter TrkG [Candidatus Sericytochromatia bacterium]